MCSAHVFKNTIRIYIYIYKGTDSLKAFYFRQLRHVNLVTKRLLCCIFIVNPHNRRKIICASFPQFTLAGCELQFVDSSRYLGHIIDNSLCDDKDTQRQVKALFTRTNILCRALSVVLYK